jgi:2-polyprenyl-6-methoxyphenol hydroxylase-like FAD-dependent oxidoreductase
VTTPSNTASAKGLVLVVGAGPVGMTMSSELSRYGISVRIVDKAPRRTEQSKALVLWSRTLELLERGARAAPFIDAGFRARAVNIIAGDTLIGHVSMDAVRSPYPFGLILPQSETERLLEEWLGALGISVERQVELASLVNGDDGIEAVLRHPDGREEAVSAAWLVGCDGAHSTVRHGLGVPFTGETMDSDWMLADVHVQGYPFPDSELSVFWHREGVFVVFPISPGRYRLIADLPSSGVAHSPAPTLAQVQAVMERRGPPGMVASDPVWLAGFNINGRKVSNYRWGRTFLAGDAAHIHSPAGGQGMNTGMQDAFNLAWKLALVMHGTCGEQVLDSYSPERSAVGDEVLKAAGRLTAVATLRNPLAQAARNLVGHLVLGLSPVRHAVAETVTELSIGYPASPLNGAALPGNAAPKPGQRVAPIDGEVPIGSGDRPRFALFARPSSAAEALIGEFAELLEPALRPPFREDALWLVRPDGYVACSATDVGTIAAYLRRMAPGNLSALPKASGAL